MQKLSDRVAELAMERIVSLLADRVADKVVQALMAAGFDKQFAVALIKSLEKEAENL